MSEMMPGQIVRNMLPGELLPVFSTVDLLMGRAYCDPIMPSAEDESTRSVANRNQSMFYAKRRAELAVTIRKMLSAQKNVPAIAKLTGKSMNTVKKVILEHPDLKRLYENLPNPENGITRKREERFKPHRASIRQWLKEGRSFPYMAAILGINRSVIRHYVLDHPELRK